jgi:hypothetical protein
MLKQETEAMAAIASIVINTNVGEFLMEEMAAVEQILL